MRYVASRSPFSSCCQPARVNTGFYLLIPYLATHLTENLGLSAAVVGVVLGSWNLRPAGLFVIGVSASDRLGARGRHHRRLCPAHTRASRCSRSATTWPSCSPRPSSAGSRGRCSTRRRAYLAQEAEERRAEASPCSTCFATTGALIGPLLAARCCSWTSYVGADRRRDLSRSLTVAQALCCRPGGRAERGRVLADWREVLGKPRLPGVRARHGRPVHPGEPAYLLLPDGARGHRLGRRPPSRLFVVRRRRQPPAPLRLTRALKRRGDRARWIAAGLGLMALAFLPPALATTVSGGPDGVADAVLRCCPCCRAPCCCTSG
ncbi:hypothetical protein GCM10023238_06560 [Streptomyces heliomycini]